MEKMGHRCMLSLVGGEHPREREDKTGQDRTGPLFNCLIYRASSKPLSVGGEAAPAADKQTRAASQLEQDIILAAAAVVPD